MFAIQQWAQTVGAAPEETFQYGEMTATSSALTSTPTTLASVSLPKGTWKIYYSADVVSGSGAIAFIQVTNCTNAQQYAGVNPSSGISGSGLTLAGMAVAVLTSTTVVDLQGVCSAGTATAYKNLFGSTVNTQITAVMA
jgi:hypothetical protein